MDSPKKLNPFRTLEPQDQRRYHPVSKRDFLWRLIAAVSGLPGELYLTAGAAFLFAGIHG
jgi:hypothetical protein